MTKYYYRYIDVLYTNDEVRVRCEQWGVIKETKSGIVLENGKFVNHDWKKKFAHPTKKEAWTSFIARKKRQIKILTYQLERANKALIAPINDYTSEQEN